MKAAVEFLGMMFLLYLALNIDKFSAILDKVFENIMKAL